MKKIFSILFLIICINFMVGCAKQEVVGMPNPWSDCNDNLKEAAKIAGFKFPLILSNYQVRAMKGMIEISYPLDEFRTVTVRKSEKNENGDISGVYNQYPINKEIRIKNGVPIQIRANRDKIYVMNMSASTGYYSAYCKDGMSYREVEGIYEVIRQAEEPKFP